MTFNANKIYRYKFNSVSNKKWKFEIQFLAGALTAVGDISTDLLPDGLFYDTIEIEASFKKNLHLGFKEADLLKTKVNLSLLVGDWLPLRNLLLKGGVENNGNIYPNQFRLLSNEGDGTDICTRIHFWGASDLLPANKYSKQFTGDNDKYQSEFTLQIFSVERFLLNSNLTKDNKAMNGGSKDIYAFIELSGFDVDLIDQFGTSQFQYEGLNTGSQNILTFGQFGGKVQVWSAETLRLFFSWLLNARITQFLRSWLQQNTNASPLRDIVFDLGSFDRFTLRQQLYDLTTNAGTTLNVSSEIYYVMFIRNSDDVIIGGMFSANSRNGMVQFNSHLDYFNSISESGMYKSLVKWGWTDGAIADPYMIMVNSFLFGTTATEYFNINDVISIVLNDINYNICKVKVNFSSLTGNRNNVELDVFGGSINDSHELKALMHNNIQLASADNTTFDYSDIDDKSFFLNNLSEAPINQPYYFKDNDITKNLYLVHRKASVDLGASITVATDETSYPLTTLRDALTEGNGRVNYGLLVEFLAKEYSISGLSYLQAKAIKSIYKSSAVYTELEIINYKLTTANLGDDFRFDMNSLVPELNDVYKVDNHNVVSITTDYLTGRSKVGIFTRGI